MLGQCNRMTIVYFPCLKLLTIICAYSAMLRKGVTHKIFCIVHRSYSGRSEKSACNVYVTHQLLVELPKPDSERTIEKIAREFVNLKQSDILRGPTVVPSDDAAKK